VGVAALATTLRGERTTRSSKIVSAFAAASLARAAFGCSTAPEGTAFTPARDVKPPKG
jgi:hypothetical protein